MSQEITTVQQIEAKQKKREHHKEQERILAQEINNILNTERLHHEPKDADFSIKARFDHGDGRSTSLIRLVVESRLEDGKSTITMNVSQARALAGWIKKHLG